MYLKVRKFGFWTLLLLILGCSLAKAQPVPAEVENINFLVTFGPKADKTWGDDDFSQTFFFIIPENCKTPIYIRVFDPDTGGLNDEMNGTWDTEEIYYVFGGKGAYTNPDAQETEPKGNYKSGNMLASKKFGVNPQYDNKWYTFGPFNPSEGEYVKEFSGYIFKVICDGLKGDDGNMYRYFLSTSPTENRPIEGANAFTYEYCFRMWDNPKQVSHIYPFVDDKTVSIRVANYDWDDDGTIRVVSTVRKEKKLAVSNQGDWKQDEFMVLPEEKNASLDFQFIKKQNPPVHNNNVVINVRNQYGKLLRFYTVPIGGVPKYKYSIGVRKK